MERFNFIKFKDKEYEINVKLDPEAKTAWFTSADMQKLLGRDKANISRHLNAVLKTVNQKSLLVATTATNELNSTKKVGRNAGYYDLEIFMKIAKKINPDVGVKVYNFVQYHLNKLTPEIVNDNDIVIYDNGNLKIPVAIAGIEQTVYMTQDDIAVLFGTTRENINQHIKNIAEEGELDLSPVSKYYLHTGSVHNYWLYTDLNL